MASILVVAKFESLSIVAGQVYEWTPYDLEIYERYGEAPPKIRRGVLTGIDGKPPTCVSVPETAIAKLELDEYLDFL